jgi:hypothetical protein
MLGQVRNMPYVKSHVGSIPEMQNPSRLLWVQMDVIGSLFYLCAFRPNIMLSVCVCVCAQDFKPHQRNVI